MKKVAFEFTEEMLDQLDQIVEKMGFASRTDLFNEAVSFFEFCFDHVEETGKLPIVVSEDGEQLAIHSKTFRLAQANYSKRQEEF